MKGVQDEARQSHQNQIDNLVTGSENRKMHFLLNVLNINKIRNNDLNQCVELTLNVMTPSYSQQKQSLNISSSKGKICKLNLEDFFLYFPFRFSKKKLRYGKIIKLSPYIDSFINLP